MYLPLTAEDVMVGVFFHLKHDEVPKLTADRETLHNVFYKIKEKFPQIMSVFSFREREHFPESSQLDQALSNLDAAGLISRQNLTPKYYRLEEPLDESYSKFSQKILSEAGIREEQIEELTSAVKTLLTGSDNVDI